MASDFLPEPNGDGFPSAANGSSSGPGSPEAPMQADLRGSSGGASSSSLKGMPKSVEEVMSSDIGITTLLNRLKQSIASARDFAAFLKKRSSLEEEQAQGLRRLVRAQAEATTKIEVKGGSYRDRLAEVMKTQERVAENGMQFALSLHQMHEDLQELSNNMERDRKKWKHDGLDAEKRASDAEAAMQKAKSRYDNLAEDYDRARTGDTKGSRRMGLKGPKSAEQHESDLLRKVQASDSDYQEKVQGAKSQHESLLSRDRPEAVRKLAELCRECDSGLALQLQKFATFNEKLLLGNGLVVSPLTGESGPGGARSMRDIISDIDNDKDLYTYLGSHYTKIPARPSEIVYQQHPTLASKTQQPSSRSASGSVPSQPVQQQERPEVPRQPTLNVNTGTASQPSSMNSRYSQPPGPLLAASQPQQYGQGPLPSPPQQYQTGPPPPQHVQSPAQYQQSPYSAQQPPYATAPPYPTHASERQSSYPPPQQQPAPYMSGAATALPSLPSQQRQQQQAPISGTPVSPSMASNNLPPLRPVFGVSLDELFNRDQSAVPMVVIQCILAVDTFGLDVEGIYRLSGTSSHVANLKAQFNNNPSSIDFRNPANFFHDVNSVATLLKAFFKDLPDPLFTTVGYAHFIAAAKIDDEERRRDALHQGINDLPDANYATLRALVLHMHRVMQNESRNRMGASNIALCFA